MPRSQNQYHQYRRPGLSLDGDCEERQSYDPNHAIITEPHDHPAHPHQPECPCASPQAAPNPTKPPYLPFSPSLPKSFEHVLGLNTMSVVESHAEGEASDVVIGGFESSRGRTMYGRLLNFRNEHDQRVNLLLNEPRGRNGKNAIFLLKPIAQGSERCLIMVKNDAYVPFSVSSIICATNVLAELPHAGGPMPRVPFQRYVFETGAGKIMAEASFTKTLERRYRCDSVTVYCAPSFVLELGYEVMVPGFGSLKVDIAFGGVFCAFVDVKSVRVRIQSDQGEKLVEAGERIRRALAGCGLEVVHPKDYSIRGVSNIVFIERIGKDGVQKVGLSATVLSPGRLDRSPSGTSTCAWLAIQHCRGQIASETFRSYSLLGTQFFGRVRGELKVGRYNAIYPSIQGRAWITGFKQVALDPTDPFAMGFRGADQWGPITDNEEDRQEDLVGLGLQFDSIELHTGVTSGREFQQAHWESANNALGETF